jgi:Sushi repeat (SCR repeat)
MAQLFYQSDNELKILVPSLKAALNKSRCVFPSIHKMTKKFQISTLFLLTAINFIEQRYARGTASLINNKTEKFRHLHLTECGPPGMPIHGLINGNANLSADMFNPGEKVTYTCSGENTRLMKGDDVRFCTADGQWSGTRPWCGKIFELNCLENHLLI